MASGRKSANKRRVSNRTEPSGRARIHLGRSDGPARKTGLQKLTVGPVTIEAPRSTKAEVKRNIQAGQAALARAKKTIIKPGVDLDVAKGVPLFHIDPNRPDCLVREIDGKREYGVFVDGRFKKTR